MTPVIWWYIVLVGNDHGVRRLWAMVLAAVLLRLLQGCCVVMRFAAVGTWGLG